LLFGTIISGYQANEARKQAQEKENQRQEADSQRVRAEGLAAEKERQRQEAETQKTRAEGALQEEDPARQRTASALKMAHLLPVELVGKSDPTAGFSLLRDEDVYPTAERDFAWGLYNRWCLRADLQQGLERATLKGHTRAVDSVAFAPDGKALASGS